MTAAEAVLTAEQQEDLGPTKGATSRGILASATSSWSRRLSNAGGAWPYLQPEALRPCSRAPASVRLKVPRGGMALATHQTSPARPEAFRDAVPSWRAGPVAGGSCGRCGSSSTTARSPATGVKRVLSVHSAHAPPAAAGS